MLSIKGYLSIFIFFRTFYQWRDNDFFLGGGGDELNIGTFILGANLVFLLIEIPNIGGASPPSGDVTRASNSDIKFRNPEI